MAVCTLKLWHLDDTDTHVTAGKPTLMSCYRERERKEEGKKGENNSNQTSVNAYNLRTTNKNTFICVFCRHIVFHFCMCKMFWMNNEK